MKFTILFLCALAFVSATSDPVLMQISEHPASEAVFATMAVHLKADPSDVGFSTVLGLINDLIEDAKDQLQSNTLVWKKTDARCQVSAINFSDKQAYFTVRAEQILNQKNRSGEMKAMMASNKDYLERLITFLTGFEKNHQELAGELTSTGKNLDGRIQEAITACDNALAAVKEWNTAKTSFVQEALHKVTDAYLQVNSYKLVVPTSLVQTGASNGAVQKRLVQWLGQLKLSFQAKLSDVQTNGKTRVELAKKIGKDSQIAITTAQKLKGSTENGQKSYEEAEESLGKAHDLLTGLAAENTDLIKSNKVYCEVEKTNFGGSVKDLNEQIGVFKKIRDYFGTNYAKLSNYVKNKYQ